MSKVKAIIPQELLDTFRIASERAIDITLPDEKAAQTLRFRFHHARKKMRLEEHPLLEKAERVVFHIEGNVLTASPYTAKFGTALEDALAPFREELESEKELEQKQGENALANAKAIAEAEKHDRKEDEQTWLREEASRLAKLAERRKPPAKSIKQLLGAGGAKK